ncbi:MAG: 6-carboxytetrahydropterin synthase QueD, partial [Rickettsiales bacterium]|nr:6-carboxytetrahydropterin synthase QueD [Rickettsiales bacterium]
NLKEKLDHAYLNEIYSMGLPTLENIGHYIWKFIIKKNYNLHRIQISRKTCNESFIIEL